MLSSAMNHQQNVYNTLSNHVLSLKKLNNDQINIGLERDKINFEREKVQLEMLKLKNSREPSLKRLQPKVKRLGSKKKNHRGGRGRGRHQTQSQPIVEEPEDSEG